MITTLNLINIHHHSYNFFSCDENPFKIYSHAHFDSTYTKIGIIQRRLAWPLCKDDTQIREAFHILLPPPYLSPTSTSIIYSHLSVQFSSVVQSCPTLCNPMNHSTPGLPVHHQLPEFTQTHAHRVGDALQPSHPLSSPSPPAPNPSQHQGLFQLVNSLHEMPKVLEFQLQHQSFQ